MPRRKTPADFHALAEKHGFRWLGPEVRTTQIKTWWGCERGHSWEAPYGRIQQGHGCPDCCGKRPKTPEDYHALAEERGFRWLGPEVANTGVNTSWECEEGHRWEANYHNVRSGTGCPDCYGNRPKTPDDYHALAEELGFRWLGPEAPNVFTKTQWECTQGHHWEAKYNDIQQKHGCPVCACRVPKTPEDYHALAEERGFRWLGPEVPTTQVGTTWECGEGHQWQAPYSQIQQGYGCRVCAGTAPKTPDDYYALAEERGFLWLGPEVPNTGVNTSWECEQGHRWEATYHNVKNGTGCPDCYGNRPKTSEDYHALAEERGIRWLGPEVPNVITKTWWKCVEGHCWEARYNSIHQGYGCPVCAGTVPKTPDDYYSLAEERGFHWLGPEVPTIKSKTWWVCDQGHKWEARYNDIQQGTGCPLCAIEQQAEQLRKKPADYHVLAAERGFRWLGPEVPNSQTTTWWECENDHRWEAVYSNIRQGYGCPFCAGVAPKTPEDYRSLAEERGFRWLGPEVPTTQFKTRWGCEQGHRWEASHGRIQQGRGCPHCAGLAPKSPIDYHALAAERGFRWLGPEVANSRAKTGWVCDRGHYWETNYSKIQQGRGCPVCEDLVHGTKVSQMQRRLCEILGGELNRPFERYNIDIGLRRSGVPIAIEYDAWYWHAGREESDAQRDEEMIAAGWRVLRVRSNTQLPTYEQLDEAIDCLLAGETQVEIVLDDWGVGPTKFEID